MGTRFLRVSVLSKRAVGVKPQAFLTASDTMEVSVLSKRAVGVKLSGCPQITCRDNVSVLSKRAVGVKPFRRSSSSTIVFSFSAL